MIRPLYRRRGAVIDALSVRSDVEMLQSVSYAVLALILVVVV